MDMMSEKIEPLNDAEKTLVDKGEWISAIKEYRIRTGHGLRVAKDLVDSYRFSPKFQIKDGYDNQVLADAAAQLAQASTRLLLARGAKDSERRNQLLSEARSLIWAAEARVK